MPQPVFIACAQQIVEDKHTGLVSLFQLIDGFQLSIRSRDEQKVPATPLHSFIGMAVWRSNDDEHSDWEYEYQAVARPPGESEQIVRNGRFQFTTRRVRFIQGLIVPNAWTQSGDFVFIHRIRRAGESEWLSQSYPIEVTVSTATPRPDSS